MNSTYVKRTILIQNDIKLIITGKELILNTIIKSQI